MNRYEPARAAYAEAVALDRQAHPLIPLFVLMDAVFHNNREMAEALRRHGYPLRLDEVPDAHNYTGWRDAFDPGLTDLLRHVWG